MARQLKKISISFTLSCLLSEFGYGSTPCQNEQIHNSECDPYYNINLVKAGIDNSNNKELRQIKPEENNIANKLENIIVKANGVQRQSDLSYFDSLRKKYSNQFYGEMSLQTFVDRSKYLNLKSINKLSKQDMIKINANKDVKPKITYNKNIPTNILTENNSSKISTIDTKLVKNKNIYIAKVGDNLIKISKKFSLNKKKLLSLNMLKNNATIKIGQKLLLAPIVKPRIVLTNINTKNNINNGIYTVKKGDTLSSIASKNRVSTIELRKLNKLSRISKLKLGQKLFLPTSKIKKRKLNSYNIAKNAKFKKTQTFKRKIRVVATAYTSHKNQTDSTPFLAAWNNRLRPGMKIIAVSPDLIKKYGLTNGVKVKILGLPGYYVVRDKMNARLRNHIDIYMGVNKRRALQWGRKRIVLAW